jgi:peptidoglycan/xylan/chitin deacetylase (PgdA/CDA1 family)
VKSLVQQAACEIAYRSGLLQAAAALTEPRRQPTDEGRFQILAYHRVGEVTDPFVPAFPAQAFARHVRYLAKHFRVLSLGELVAAAEAGTVPSRAIAITFDDGYEDTHRYVLPIVQRSSVPMTVYLTTGLLGGGSMWNDRVGAAIRDTPRRWFDCLEECGPLSLSTLAERQHVLRLVLRALKRRPPAARDALVLQIEHDLGTAPKKALPSMLSWPQVQEMHEHGVEFGAHTVTHPILTAVSLDEARREVAESKRAIEDRLQMPVRHFAYPNGVAGDFDGAVKAAVREAGFASAASMVFGVNTPRTDRYELRRGGPWTASTAEFATRLWWYRHAAGASALS